MSFKSIAFAAIAALSFAAPAFADSNIMIKDAYARVSSKAAKAGAAFLVLHNMGSEDDRLVGVRTDVAAKSELHTHKDMGDGVMKMMHVEEGFSVPAGETYTLMRGGDHLMMMGLNRSLAHGDIVKAVLVFENAGEISVEIPVDLERKPDHGMAHGDMNHGKMKHGDKEMSKDDAHKAHH
ncbi:copper chaperone PCu(A)C [Cognatishimia sp. WU-CL00825]|uniref:copper chaperone PCu(A)C n=1 Tax=Cognatishimia sp. WU-CL00825 TaxID=3127658 RepID=UPI003102E512